ncbi:tetratricopeptide repeat protein [Crocosphaera sp. XPORK-15E]|uniref:tetratricopeptide repeat protein n=1 Tax=Crocosphaera sp. XPORK-15E TaxID=3110247 RepID=UPI002B1F1DA0|nr:tetratricopeptide repeat protein [Crocosphaera sp. XPORK-15E]MEA5532845.1 tetratricopeptide repeat protein [Crocosphaera sp. XPORK-15E]
MNQTANQNHLGPGDNVAGNKTVNNYYGQASPPPVTPTAVIDTTLPPVYKWQGRQEEMDKLKTALNDDNIRLIEITAAGGYGKTALAAKFKEQLNHDWRVFWVNFNQPYPLAQFGRWLLEQLKQAYDEKWDEETLIQQMIQALIAEPCLLVLNNLETVLTAEGNSVYHQFLSQWLGKGRNSKLLLTSREQPKFAPNLLQRCYGLPLKGLAEADAIRYVTEDYGLTGTDGELAEFVNKMARHPLLMQLVCSWMVDELGEGVCVTESENLGLDLFAVEGYHRDTETCVREVVEASLKRLSERLGDILKRLSVLRGIFALDLAQGLTAEVTDTELRYLARLSLLQEFPPEPLKGKRRRFQFLPLISMVVQQQADSEVLRSAHQSALDYFLAHLPAPPWESLDDLTAYLEGFYHAGELGEWQLAFDILNEERGGEGKNKSVYYFLDLQGFYRQQAQLYEQVSAGSQREQDCYRYSLNRLGNCYDSLGQYEKAIAYQQQHHDISEEIGDRQGVAASLGNLGLCHRSLGKYQTAIKYHKKSLKIQKEMDDRQSVANSYGSLGLCYRCLGKYQKAIKYHKRHHDISEEIGDRQGVATSLGNLGSCYRLLERYEEAIAHHQQSLDISEEIGHRQGVAISLGNLGNCYGSLGQYEKAIAYYQQYHDISKEIGYRRGIANSLNNIGEALLKLENYSEAESKIQESLVISQEINVKPFIAESLKALAEIAHKTNRPELAFTHCQEALELSQQLGIPLVKDCEELLAKIQDSDPP